MSICTPTFNRRPFLPYLVECVRQQTYPHEKIEWVIVDDGTDSIADAVAQFRLQLDIPIHYLRVEEKMPLGKKRNYLHTHATGDILVNMDDDDYYPPDRVAHAVSTLLRHPEVLIAGSSVMYLYFKTIQKMYRFGPYGANHATAATFAFRRELLDQTSFPSDTCVAEETAFLKNYTIPMVQLDPEKTILVFSHRHNSVDKMEVLQQGPVSENPYISESVLTPHEFIRDERLHAFYVENIDSELAGYDAGAPCHKPDVLLNVANNKVAMYEKRFQWMMKELQESQTEVVQLREINRILTERLKQMIQGSVDKHKSEWRPAGGRAS